MIKIAGSFPRYTEFGPKVPVYCVTPDTGRTVHRFFDTSPFSPSGRYMALFRLPQEERLPRPGEEGEIVLVDLHTGGEQIVATTKGWETQMGANVQWGSDDRRLLFNDVVPGEWSPFCTVLDPFTGKTRRLGGGIYRASPDGKKIASAELTAMRRTQNGYGVVVPDDKVPRNFALRDDDGLYITDVETGERKLLISIKDCVERAVPRSEFNDYEDFEVYGFHCKWNNQGTRLIFTLRGYPVDHPNRFDVIGDGPALKFDVYTLDNEAREVCLAVPAREWAKGGHHINWFPDGENLSMNLNIDEDGLKFVQAGYDGTGLRAIFSEIPGSGHPTVHPNGRHILTDEYAGKEEAFDDGTVPIRMVDRMTGEDETLIRIKTMTPQQEAISALRVDPHPAWDPSYEWIAFNGFADGTRRVYIADMRGFVGSL